MDTPLLTRLNKQQYEAVMLSVRRIMAVLLFDDVLRDKASELQTAFRKTNPNATVAVYEDPQDWMAAIRMKFPRGFKVLRFDFPGILKFINTVSNAWGDRMIVDQFAKLANYAFAKMKITHIFVYRRANELYLAVDPAKHIDIKAAKSSLGGYFNAGGKVFKELAVLSEAEITDLVPEGIDGTGTAVNTKKLSAMFGTLAGGIVERTNGEIFADYLVPVWQQAWRWVTKSQAQKLADRDYLINYENPFDKRGIDRITGIGATEEEIAGLKKFYREVSPGSGEVTDAGGAYAALIRILTRIRDTQTRGPGQTGSWWQPFSDHQTSALVMPNQPIFSTIVNTFFSWKEHSLAPFSNTNIPPGIPGEDAQVPNDESLLVAYANASDVVVPTLEPLNGTEVNDAAVVQRIERTLKAIRSSAKLTSDVWNDERIKIAAQGLVLYRMIYAEGSKNLQHLLAHQEVLQGFIGVRPIKSLGKISESGGAIRGGFSNVQNIDDALVELQTLIKKYGDGFMSVERINYSGVSYVEGVSIELMNHRAIEWNVQKYNAYFEGIRPADSVVWLVQHPEKWPGVPYFNGEQSYFNEFRYGILSGFPPAAVDRHAWNNARPTDFIASIIDIYKLFRGGWHMVKVGIEYPEMRAPGIVNVLDRIGYGFVPYTLADVHWIREIGVLEAVTQAFLNLTQEERVSAETLPQGERTDGFLGINSDCFSMNPFIVRVYAADGQQGNTCHPFFRAPVKVIREWWGDQQVLHVIDPTVVKLLKLSVAPAVDRVYIGSQRHVTNAFVVPGEQLSHQFAPDHAIVSVTNDGLVLQNLSSWGTWVNGTPVEVNASQRMLYGDEIVFGQDPQDPEEHQLWRYQVDMDADGRVVLRRASPVDALGAAAISLPVWFPAGAMENAGQHAALLRPSDTFRLAAIGGIPTHTDERIVIAYTSAGGNRSSLEIKPTTSVRGIIDNLPRQVTSFRIYRGKTKQYRQVGVLDVRPDGWVSVRGIAGNAAFAAETQVPDPAEAAGNRTLNWLQNARFDAAGQLIMAAVQKARDDGCFSVNPFMTRVYAASVGETADEVFEGNTCPIFLRAPQYVIKQLWKHRRIVRDILAFDIFLRLGLGAYPYITKGLVLPAYTELPLPLEPGFCTYGGCTNGCATGFQCSEASRCCEPQDGYTDSICSAEGNAEIRRVLTGSLYDSTETVGCDGRGCSEGKCIGYDSEQKGAPLCSTLPPAEDWQILGFEDDIYLPAQACRNADGEIEWRLGILKSDFEDYTCNADRTSIIRAATGEAIWQCGQFTECDDLDGNYNCVPKWFLAEYMWSSECNPLQTRNDGFVCTREGLRCTPGQTLPKTNDIRCDRVCTDGMADTAKVKWPVNCVPYKGDYSDNYCGISESGKAAVFYKTMTPLVQGGELSQDGGVIQMTECETNKCVSGACAASAKDVCGAYEEGKTAMKEDGSCLLTCRDGKYEETSVCGKDIKILSYNNNGKQEILEALSLLPDHILEGAHYSTLRHLWYPRVNSIGNTAVGTANAMIDLSNINVMNNSFTGATAEVVIHEYMHEWATTQAAWYPYNWPLADILNVAPLVTNFSQQGIAPAPIDYIKAVGCKKENEKFSYASSPITGYSGLPVDEVECGEDFADSAAWYVTRACDLLKGGESGDAEAGKVRYDYMKEQVFGGREYIPPGGCGNQ